MARDREWRAAIGELRLASCDWLTCYWGIWLCVILHGQITFTRWAQKITCPRHSIEHLEQLKYCWLELPKWATLQYIENVNNCNLKSRQPLKLTGQQIIWKLGKQVTQGQLGHRNFFLPLTRKIKFQLFSCVTFSSKVVFAKSECKKILVILWLDWSPITLVLIWKLFTSFHVVQLFIKHFHFWVSYITFFSQNTFSF
jgi:hypothetical protein